MSVCYSCLCASDEAGPHGQALVALVVLVSVMRTD